MASEDFYRILGVSPAASADEVRSAYRELVKRYHPDLFSTSGEKSRANEKLQRINEAYAVIGDTKRRREYDEKRSPRPPTHRPNTASAVRRASGMRKPASPLRWSRSAVRRVPGWWKRAVSAKWIALLLPVVMLALIAHAVWEKPQAAVAWTLLAATTVEPIEGTARPKAGPTWTALGSYGSRSQCGDALKDIVKRDEQQGSKAVFDERYGSIAITVQVRDEHALAQEYFRAKSKQAFNEPGGKESVDDQQLLKQATEDAKEFIKKNGLTKRVRSYECRLTQVLEPESWLRRKLRELRILS
jgi:curved DNA-binding protein CbpA